MTKILAVSTQVDRLDGFRRGGTIVRVDLDEHRTRPHLVKWPTKRGYPDEEWLEYDMLTPIAEITIAAPSVEERALADIREVLAKSWTNTMKVRRVRAIAAAALGEQPQPSYVRIRDYLKIQKVATIYAISKDLDIQIATVVAVTGGLHDEGFVTRYGTLATSRVKWESE